MAYTKQNWECGDLITADKMNHIEDGIEDASSGGSPEPIVGSIDADLGNTSIDFAADNLFHEETVSQDSGDTISASFYTLSDAKTLASGGTATPLTFNELKEAIDSGADVSAMFSDSSNHVSVPLHLDRIESLADPTTVVLNGASMFAQQFGNNSSGCAFYVHAYIASDNCACIITWKSDASGK